MLDRAAPAPEFLDSLASLTCDVKGRKLRSSIYLCLIIAGARPTVAKHPFKPKQLCSDVESYTLFSLWLLGKYVIDLNLNLNCRFPRLFCVLFYQVKTSCAVVFPGNQYVIRYEEMASYPMISSPIPFVPFQDSIRILI